MHCNVAYTNMPALTAYTQKQKNLKKNFAFAIPLYGSKGENNERIEVLQLFIVCVFRF